MDLTKIKKIYMIGVKGVGMTMLAQFFAAKGIEVVGSDTHEKFMTDRVLADSGVKVIEKFSAKNIPADADLIIYSSAYNDKNNIEVELARSSKIKVLTYAAALGGIFNQKYGIAVVGSHGKTTTTAWLGFVMRQAGIRPNVMVGARVPQFNGSSLVGDSDYLLIEADEYQNKLQSFQPQAVLLNNIDYDHPDFFRTPEEYRDVFVEFIKKIPPKGFLVANFDDPLIRKIAAVNCRGKIVSYAIDEASAFASDYSKAAENNKASADKADFVAYNIRRAGGEQYFKVKLAAAGEEDIFSNRLAAEDYRASESELGDFNIKLAGRHNIYNALAVISAAIELGVELVDIRRYLSEFGGTARRMEKLGEFEGAAIIDDYAHHPAEIKATLAGARELYPKANLTVVFHPHTFTRTKALLDDFAASFDLADQLIVLDIYGSAREVQGGVHSRDLVKKIVETRHGASGSVRYIPTLKEAEKYLRENAKRNDVIILMGAGDVFRIGQSLVGAVDIY